VGGIKQKALAAQRAGITTFILPKRNDVDLDELPEEIHNDLTFVLAETMEDVLKAAMPEGFAERVLNEHHADAEGSAEIAARGAA
jgi:ATP-dependent Lon protease